LDRSLEGRPVHGVRLEGGGPPLVEERDPDIERDLAALVEAETGGDPMGGSNGDRPRRWKQQLPEPLADRLGLEVVVSRYPTGASNWNPVDHRLFGPISINWAGKPLRTFDTMLSYIRRTTTETGLKVKAFLLDRLSRAERKE
jgi:hypothetical protein